MRPLGRRFVTPVLADSIKDEKFSLLCSPIKACEFSDTEVTIVMKVLESLEQQMNPFPVRYDDIFPIYLKVFIYLTGNIVSNDRFSKLRLGVILLVLSSLRIAWETFAPVVRQSTIRMFLALAVEYNLILHQMDVQSAYLNGEIKEEIFMTQSENFVSRKYPEKVCLRFCEIPLKWQFSRIS
ncbi:hypothetical protein LAZ67_12002215 [Cordylochernes scorpioides]|uniref:Reverse transcriptase Ty1/copia-type domain-containing protein n=1 Tax=Cordylochernes scorpioides TaxID=51811 RepID=A0ABY6L1L6_9ARAC|nr:hypothetical protein LAZ67_12002215 [Cordylochernes scorpioides]